jgi:hypothetical protein
MKDAYEVLQQKQMDLARVRKEIDSLNLVARLLSDDDTSDNPIQKPEEGPPSSLSDTISRLSDSAAKNVDSLFTTVETSRSGLWGSRKRAK